MENIVEKDGIVYAFSECDEVVTGYYKNYPEIIQEGNNFGDVKKKLEEARHLFVKELNQDSR